MNNYVALSPLSQSFKDSCRKFYEAEMEELDFKGATEQSRQHINTWVAKKTEGEPRVISFCLVGWMVLGLGPMALNMLRDSELLSYLLATVSQLA